MRHVIWKFLSNAFGHLYTSGLFGAAGAVGICATLLTLSGCHPTIEIPPEAEELTIISTPVEAATALTWVEATPSRLANVTARWTPSVSLNVRAQKIQFYSGPLCSTPLGAAIELLSGVTDSRTLSVSAGQSYSYRLTTEGQGGDSAVSVCSASISILPPLPVVTVAAASVNIASNSSTFLIGGLCNLSGQIVSVKVDTVAAVLGGAGGACDGSVWSGTINTTALAEGAHTLQATLANSLSESADSIVSSLIKDTGAPTVVIASTAPATTGTSPIPVTVTFNESVSGFVSGDVTVSNGAVTNFAGSGTTYTFDVTPSVSGVVTVDVLANKAQDAAGNPNVAATQLTRTYDSDIPGVVLTSAAPSATNSSSFTVTATFSKSVTGFVVGDIAVTNGTASNFAGSGTTYTFDVTASGQGAVSVNVAAGVAQDAASNNNTAAVTLTRTYDSVQPTVVISSTAAAITNVSPIPVTVTFNESVTGFIAGDLTIVNGTAGNFAGSGTTYTFDVTPSGQGAVTVDVLANKAQDTAGNGNTAATQLTRTYDSAQPTVVISSAAAATTNVSPIPVTVTFNESVTGFIAGDLTIVNGTAGNFAGSGTTYTFDVTPSGQGAVTVNVAAGVAQDGAGNLNTVATQLSRTYDSQGPTTTITSAAAATVNTSPIAVTVTFSESVTGFAVGDLTVVNGTAGNFAGSGTTYTVDISPSGQGAVTVNVAAGVAQDSAGNGNQISNQLTRTYDSVKPSVTLSTTAPATTNTSPIPVSVSMSKSVVELVAADITVTNGTAGNIAGSGASYTFDVTPSGQGVVTIKILADAVTDAVGNTNTVSNTLSVTYDSSNPTLTLSSTTNSTTNVSPIPVTATFNKSVTGFIAGDITVVNGAVSNFAGSGASYTFDVTPAGQGTVTVDVAQSVAVDGSGNGNTAAGQLLRTYDSGSPTVTISSTAPNSTNTSPIPVTVLFSESVTGFASGDVTVVNGTISAFAGSGAGYSFNVTPSGQGAVTVDISAAVAQDAAGNNNLVAVQLLRKIGRAHV